MDVGALRKRLLRHAPLLLALLAVLVWRVEQARGLVLPACNQPNERRHSQSHRG